MNVISPKIKFILLFLLSPIFSFLGGDLDVSELSEMGYLWGFSTEQTSALDDKDSSEKDFSIDQLSLYAVNSTYKAADFLTDADSDVEAINPNTFAHLLQISERDFLTTHHFHSSYLRGHNQSYTLARHLLWEVFLI